MAKRSECLICGRGESEHSRTEWIRHETRASTRRDVKLGAKLKRVAADEWVEAMPPMTTELVGEIERSE